MVEESLLCERNKKRRRIRGQKRVRYGMQKSELGKRGEEKEDINEKTGA